MWQLGVSKSQIWSFNMCSMYPQVWKVYQSVVKYSVYLYFNVTLFSSKEGKYNLPSILKGAGKNLVLVFIAISYNISKQPSVCADFLFYALFRLFCRAGYSLGDWSLRKVGGWWTESDKYKAEDLSQCPPVSAVLTAGGFAVTWAWILPSTGREGMPSAPSYLNYLPDTWRCWRGDLVWLINWTIPVNKLINILVIISAFFSSHISFLTPDLELASKNECERLWKSSISH